MFGKFLAQKFFPPYTKIWNTGGSYELLQLNCLAIPSETQKLELVSHEANNNGGKFKSVPTKQILKNHPSNVLSVLARFVDRNKFTLLEKCPSQY